MEKQKTEPVDLSETTLKTKMVVPMLLFVITAVTFFLGFKYTMESEARKFAYDVQLENNNIKNTVQDQVTEIKSMKYELTELKEEAREQKQKTEALQIDIIQLKANR